MISSGVAVAGFITDQGEMEKLHCPFPGGTVMLSVPVSSRQGSAPSMVALPCPYCPLLALSLAETTLSHTDGMFFSTTSEFIFNLSDSRWAG